jgi:quercetin dioxygenase-like cupin family protein
VSDPYVIAAAQGRHIQGPTGPPMMVKIDGRSVHDAYSLLEYTHEAGAAGPPAHVHHEHEEAFHVMEGQLTLTVDGTEYTLGPGDYAVVPRGAVHRPSNAGDVPTRFFFINSPAMDGFFVAMADLNAATDGAPSPADLADLGARWDTEFVDLPGQGSVAMVNEQPPGGDEPPAPTTP